MKRFILIPAVVCFVLALSAFAATAPEEGGYYQGTLDDHAIVMVVNTGVDQNDGDYRYLQYGPPIWLKNKTKSDGSLFLTELSGATGKAVAQFRGKLDGQHNFKGQWVSADGKRSLPFDLKRIAEMKNFSVRDSHFFVQSSAPQFTSQSPFYTALNALLTQNARSEMDELADNFRKSGDPGDATYSWEGSSSVEILHADENMVSLLYRARKDTGGARMSVAFSSVTYIWRDGKVVELDPADMVSKDSTDRIVESVIQSLKKQKASWPEEVKTIDFNHIVMNPTAGGLMFTFAPYEVDETESRCVTLPYSSLKGAIPANGPLAHLMREHTPFNLTEDSAMEQVMASKRVAGLKQATPNRRLICRVEEVTADAIYVYLGEDQGDHTARIDFCRVTKDGRVWFNQDQTGFEERWAVAE